MSQIIDLMVFFSNCLYGIFNSLDNTMLGTTSMLSIICSMGYISITLWGVFSLLNSGDNSNNDIQ